MRKLILLRVVLASVMMITSCKENDEVIQISLLKKNWIQSYEEKKSVEIEIYRPSDYIDFPISRYRQIFNFYDNNMCDYRILAANDGHYMKSGSWEFNDKTNIIKIFNTNSEMIFEFEVFELTGNLLKLKAKKLISGEA